MKAELERITINIFADGIHVPDSSARRVKRHGCVEEIPVTTCMLVFCSGKSDLKEQHISQGF